MLRKLIAVLVAASLTFPVAASYTVRRGGNTAVASAYTDILFWLNFENDTTTDPYDMNTGGATPEYSAGPTVGSCSAAEVGCMSTGGDHHSASDPGSYVKTGAARIGTYGLHVQGDTVRTEGITWQEGGSQDFALAAKGVLGLWIYKTASCGTNNILTIGSTSAGVGKLSVTCTTTDRINANYFEAGTPATATATSSNNTFPVGAWRFIQVLWDDTANANTLTLKIYNPDTLGTDTATNAVAYAPTGSWANTLLDMGNISVLSTFDMYFDNLMISSSETRNFITDTGPDTVTLLMNYTGSPR